MTKIKVLFLIDGLRFGGKERRIIELLKVLVQANEYEIIVYSTKRDILYKEFYTLGIPINYVVKAESSFFSTIFQLKKGIKEFKPDIVHCWSSYTASLAIASMFAMSPSFKLINSQITNVPPKLNRFSTFWFQTKFNFLFSNIILSNTEKGLEVYNAPKNKSFCIYNGFDLNRVLNLDKPEIVKKRFKLEDQKVIGMIGAVENKKDYHCYINAAKELLTKRKDIVFFIVGDGSKLNIIKSLIEEKEKSNFIFTGNMQDVENIIQIFDVGVLCTNDKVHGEGISNVILEMMAQAKPVIATLGGGTQEIISNGKNGLLIKPGDSNELCNSILNLLDKPEDFSFLGVEASRTVVEKFDNINNNNKYCKLYKKINN